MFPAAVKGPALLTVSPGPGSLQFNKWVAMVDAETLRRALGPLQLPAGELDDLLAAAQQLTPQGIRVRSPDIVGSLGLPLQAVPWHPRAFTVDRDHRVSRQVSYAAGQYYIQDVGSLLAVTLLGVQAGHTVCDLCAAPGGKSTAILEELGDSGWLLANEVIHSRAGALQFNLARHGSTRYVVGQLDPVQFAEQTGAVFERVLVDAPCSGQSLVARGKQTDAAFQPRAIEHCAARQRRILHAASHLVRPGGRLVYSTCTYSYAENEQQIEQFLREESEWRATEMPELAQWRSGPIPGCYRLWPHRDFCGGAFAAALERDSNDSSECHGASSRRQRTRLDELPLPDDFATWGQLDEVRVMSSVNRVFAWPDSLWQPLVPLAVAGPEIAFRKNTTWFPSYGLAMRRDSHWQPSRQWLLDDQQAEQYVQGQTLDCPHQGWAVAAWRDLPLGWCKADGRRAKNHLPKPARLLAS